MTPSQESELAEIEKREKAATGSHLERSCADFLNDIHALLSLISSLKGELAEAKETLGTADTCYCGCKAHQEQARAESAEAERDSLAKRLEAADNVVESARATINIRLTAMRCGMMGGSDVSPEAILAHRIIAYDAIKSGQEGA